MRKTIILSALMLLVTGSVWAQMYPERSQVRKGNRDFDKERYDKSIEHYTKALEAAPGNFEAGYDLSSALYRTEKYEEAAQRLQQLALDSTRTETERAETFYNLGNAQFKQQKLQEALESYKNSLRLNPSDQEAKYNYAYTKRLLEQQQQNQQNQDQNKDQNQQQDKNQQNQNQNQDQNQNQNDRNQDQNKDQNDQDRNQDQQQDKNRQDQQNGKDDPNQQGDNPQDQPRQSDRDGESRPGQGIAPEEQERMLDAIQAQEDKTQEKLKEKAGVVVRGGKNW